MKYQSKNIKNKHLHILLGCLIGSSQKVRISGSSTPFISRWNNPLFETIDPNFHPDIQVQLPEFWDFHPLAQRPPCGDMGKPQLVADHLVQWKPRFRAKNRENHTSIANTSTNERQYVSVTLHPYQKLNSIGGKHQPKPNHMSIYIYILYDIICRCAVCRCHWSLDIENVRYFL